MRFMMAGKVRLELTTCGFGDRRSSQLSYFPSNVLQCDAHSARLAVKRVLTLELAILLLFQTTGSVALLLHRRVVAPLALGALQNDQFARHCMFSNVDGYSTR